MAIQSTNRTGTTRTANRARRTGTSAQTQTRRKSGQARQAAGDRVQVSKREQANPSATSDLTQGLAQNFGGGNGLLTRGAKGDEVKALQRQLNEKLGLDLKVDGDFGKDTQSAVRKFQKAQNLDVDGKVGKDTWGALGGQAKGKTEEQPADGQKADPAGKADPAAKAEPAGQTEKAQEVDKAKPSGGKWQNPVPGARLSSKFGKRKAPVKGASTFHKGIDLAAPAGTKIGAARGGVVTRSGWDKGYGNWVEVRHSDGTSSRYGHMQKRGVKVGQEVDQGDRLGSVGSTGRSSGNHLHFEIRDAKGRPVDPLKHMSL